MSKSPPGKYRKLIINGREYLNTRYNLLRLELLEKVSSMIALLILVMVGIILACSMWVYISGILIVLMEKVFGNYIVPLIIMGGLSLLALVLIIILRDKFILNPLIRRFSKILFDDMVEMGDDDDDEDLDDNSYQNGKEDS